MTTIWTPDRKKTALATLGKWQSTPHRDRIAIPGVGIDCIQLVLQVLIDCEVIPAIVINGYDTTAGMHSHSDRLQRAFKSCMDLEDVPAGDPQFGDLAIFKTGNRSGHCGFITEGQIWHALARRSVTFSDYKLWRWEIETLLRIKAVGFTGNPHQAAKL